MFNFKSHATYFKGRSHRLRPKAYILDDTLGNPYDGLKVLFWQPYGPYKGTLWPKIEELVIFVQKNSLVARRSIRNAFTLCTAIMHAQPLCRILMFLQTAL